MKKYCLSQQSGHVILHRSLYSNKTSESHLHRIASNWDTPSSKKQGGCSFLLGFPLEHMDPRRTSQHLRIRKQRLAHVSTQCWCSKRRSATTCEKHMGWTMELPRRCIFIYLCFWHCLSGSSLKACICLSILWLSLYYLGILSCVVASILYSFCQYRLFM